MKELNKYFPKHVGLVKKNYSRVVVKSFSEMINMINKCNKIVDKIHYSLYNCADDGGFTDEKHKIHKCVMIDKLGLDLDSLNRFQNIKKSHKKLLKNDIKHMMFFSTYGFWLYVFTKNYEELQYKRNCLKNSLKWLVDFLELTMGEPKVADTDFHCTDIPRVARMPMSYDIKRKLYCINITTEDLEKGLEFIQDKAKQQIKTFKIYGTKTINMKKFDYPNKEKYDIDIPDTIYKFIESDKMIDDFLPCMKTILLEKGKDTWDNRWTFAVYCREMCLPKSFCDEIAKKYFGRTIRSDGIDTNYDHFVKFNVMNLAYSRDDDFPNCETLFSKGLCKGKCEFYGKRCYK